MIFINSIMKIHDQRHYSTSISQQEPVEYVKDSTILIPDSLDVNIIVYLLKTFFNIVRLIKS